MMMAQNTAERRGDGDEQAENLKRLARRRQSPKLALHRKCPIAQEKHDDRDHHRLQQQEDGKMPLAHEIADGERQADIKQKKLDHAPRAARARQGGGREAAVGCKMRGEIALIHGR
ncbi:MAG TPA: hypothetical protein VEH07_06170 [Alphaproteobacteria bacterium]|nr:hypothetical protein [Alphaproteobacteria bacterium]